MKVKIGRRRRETRRPERETYRKDVQKSRNITAAVRFREIADDRRKKEYNFYYFLDVGCWSAFVEQFD